MAILLPNGKQQFFTSAGVPLVGGKVYTYVAGTSTPKATYSDASGTVSNTNPVILDSRGEATIFWSGAYKVVLKDSLDNTIYTVDNIDTSVDITEITYDGVALSTIIKTAMMTVVNSITDLKAVDKTYYNHAYVTGYYTKGDGGGGHYYYDSTDTTTADNGGTVIVATDTGRWKLLTNGQPWSVLQFGAKPDYTTDATTAIQAAIDALGGEGGIVTVDGSFLIGNLTVKTNVTLKGNNGNPTQISTGTYGPTNHPSVLVLPSANTITMQTGARLEGLLILEQDLAPGQTYALPLTSGNAASAVSGFAGTAVTPTAGAYDVELVNCMVLGFEWAFETAAGGAHFAGIFDSVLVDGTNGFYLYPGYQTDVFELRGVRCEPFLTAHLADVTKNQRTGVAFSDLTGRFTYQDCRAREFAIGFQSDNSSAHHLACSVFNDASGGNKFGFKYITGGLAVYNTDCTAWNCGSGCVYSNLPAISSELCGITIQGADFYNASPMSSADGLIYIVDGYYTITDSQLGNNITYGLIKLGANADYGSIDNITVYGRSTAIEPIFGDAAALLKMRLGTVIYRDTTPTVQSLTWTPVLKLAATASTQTSYGWFTITNQHVTCYFDITVSAKGAGSGNATITGLPYTAANETNTMLGMGGCGYYANLTTVTGAPTFSVAKNTAVIDCWDNGAGSSTALTDADITDTTRLVGWVTYRISQ